MRAAAFFVLSFIACSASRDDAQSAANDAGNDGGVQLDAGFHLDAIPSDASPIKTCKVDESGDGVVGTCTKSAPAKSFTPRVKWSWSEPTPPGTMRMTDGSVVATISGSVVTPLVANFTDDNGDGAIDLCDVPDVLVVVMEDMLGASGSASMTSTGSGYLVSGDTGKTLFSLAEKIDPNITPAIGDIDGDGLPEIVAADPTGDLVAFETDGHMKWRSALGGWKQSQGSYCHAIAIYDLDGDGAPEILAAFEVYDAKGNRWFGVPGNGAEFASGDDYWCPTPTAADLDGDGKLEVIFGSKAYRADGSIYFDLGGPPGAPHVANVDDDPEPEIVLATSHGVMVLEHDGTVKVPAFTPPENPPPAGWSEPMSGAHCWGKPGAIHDLDGDGRAELAYGSCSFYASYKISGAFLSQWSDAVSDLSGLATGTAFDFLGRGVADAIYADEHHAYVFDGSNGAVELTTPRSSGTLIEYPVVADVDSDGSADIVVVSNYISGSGITGFDRNPGDATLTVYSDASNRWIPTRRIWNQHAYHVTNVREDGTIPAHMKNNWQLLNTFRTNSQIESGSSCAPPHPR